MLATTNQSAFGVGAYTPAEAARLTGLPASALRRWLFGYSYNHHGPKVIQAPLWQPQYGVDQEEPFLGFRDLIEARMVGKLRGVGIGLPTIRLCLRTAAEIAQDDHPFSSKAFRTDGKQLFLERIGADGAREIIDLQMKQHAFAQVIERSFVDLDFDDEKATRWFLLPRKQTIVADPDRRFGEPIEANSGVPTKRLAQAMAAEGSLEKVARLFETSLAAVRDALTFEKQLTRAPAAA